MAKTPSKTITALLTLKATNEGGRRSGIVSGYRPNHVFEYFDGQIHSSFIGEVQFEGEWIQPGESRVVNIEFLFVTELEKYLVAGRKWWIHEASKLVGEAEIISI
jgi:translation elongation factor EF-Tu-like GTPase